MEFKPEMKEWDAESKGKQRNWQICGKSSNICSGSMEEINMLCLPQTCQR